MDAVPCEIENGIFCFYKMKRERPPLFFIYHNADSANNGLVVTFIIIYAFIYHWSRSSKTLNFVRCCTSDSKFKKNETVVSSLAGQLASVLPIGLMIALCPR